MLEKKKKKKKKEERNIIPYQIVYTEQKNK